MAIRQISKIQHRQGLYESLPQLSGGELGWAVDSRRLFIGNGSLTDGAPVIGNTEILTQFSDLLDISSGYTYKGEQGGYTVKTGELTSTPISRTLQKKMDERASVLDFGAVGDGTTDDTEAINRAFKELFCREASVETRRALFFPAGTYKISAPLKIPAFAKMLGDGMDSSIIKLDNDVTSTVADYVARTADSKQQTGANIGSNNATVPSNIEIEGLTFKTEESNDAVFLADRVQGLTCRNVGFVGVQTTTDVQNATNGTCGVRFAGTASQVPTNMVFDACKFTNHTYAIETGILIRNLVVANSRFNVLYQAILLGSALTNNGPIGAKFHNNLFDDVYAQGIYAVLATNVISSQNVFLDVGTSLQGGTATAATAIVQFDANNSVSIGDVFERTDTEADTHARIKFASTGKGVALDTRDYRLGQFATELGESANIENNKSSAGTIKTINASLINGIEMRYTIVRDSAERTGTFRSSCTSSPVFDDDFSENTSTGVTLSASFSGSTLSIQYTSTNTGQNGTIRFSVNHLN
tara:strand:- start:2742 stop:4325 length:1584 start_codon:yes stop_codon:yes gene_type:complete